MTNKIAQLEAEKIQKLEVEIKQNPTNDNIGELIAALRELIASNKETILSLSKEKGGNTSKNVELQKNEDLHKKINNLQEKNIEYLKKQVETA